MVLVKMTFHLLVLLASVNFVATQWPIGNGYYPVTRYEFVPKDSSSTTINGVRRDDPYAISGTSNIAGTGGGATAVNCIGFYYCVPAAGYGLPYVPSASAYSSYPYYGYGGYGYLGNYYGRKK